MLCHAPLCGKGLSEPQAHPESQTFRNTSTDVLVEKVAFELKSPAGFVLPLLTSDPQPLGCPLRDSMGLWQCSQGKLHVAPRQDSAVDSQVSNTIFLKALLGRWTCSPSCCWATAGGAV